MRNKLFVVILIFLFSISWTVSAQKLINSPYSRFNIGSLQTQGSFRSLGMGGVGIAQRDNNSIYFSNPASYSSIDTVSFLFDFGIDYGRNNISGSSSKFSSDDMNFHHLVMGFPVTKGLGIAFGIVPYSSGYYNISNAVTSSDPSYDPNIGAYNMYHNGEGGISKLFLGAGFKIVKNLSIGANLTYLAGSLSRTNQFIFTDYYNAFHNSSTESLDLRGLGTDFGIHYMATIKKNYFLNIGISLSSGNNYNGKYFELSQKYTAFGVTDTISYTSNNSVKTYIPGTLNFGIAFGKKNKFTTEIDYSTTRWSASKIPGPSGYAADTKTFTFGAELIPDKFSNYNYLSRVEYRIGAHTGNNYLIVNGQQIKEYGASVGLGFPLPKTPSKANIYFDFTRKSGSLSNSLHNEDYMTMGISLNLYDWWFLKRKYD